MKARGTQRERAVRDALQAEDWVAFRAPGSLGCADVVALKAGERPIFAEVKSDTRSPWVHFGPAKRLRLSATARLAGAEAWLVWHPPRGRVRWIREDAWPK